MKTICHRCVALIATGLTVASAARLGPIAYAQGFKARPLTAADFVQDAPRGFGDPNNSWAQSMVWWNDHLFVGTTRQSFCGSIFALWEVASGVFGRQFADTWFTYPPQRDPDMSCAPDGADLSLQAEIWSWTPDTDTWMRVFQSPLDLDNPGPGAPLPPRTGKKLPYEIAIRGMRPHTEPDGTEALYAFGANSTVMWDRTKLPPPRILRSTDGLNFTPVPQTPGTFLGDLPFNPDHSSFRSPVSYGGQLFVLSGPIFGQGSLIGSADPAKGDNAWFLASPPEIQFYEMAVFNGWLYLGTFNPLGGYSVVKTLAEGTPPYEFVTVVPAGAYLQDRPSKSVVSMHEHLGRLYVGTATKTEIIRINADDTWDLVIGPPRVVPSPDSGSEWKYPLSGLDAGFGHSLNDHAWQMADPNRYLYIGTYNASIGSKDDPVYGPLLAHNMGAHLYRTPDGWYYNAVTTNGLADPLDPYGGRFDFGFRTMATTPYGMFLGTANDDHGLAIFRATPEESAAPDPPDRLEIEPSIYGSALLSWHAASDVDGERQRDRQWGHSGEPDDPGDALDDGDGDSGEPGGDVSDHGERPGGRQRHNQRREWHSDRDGGQPDHAVWHDEPDDDQCAQTYQIWRAEVHPILVRDDLNFEAWNGVTGNKIPDTYVGPYEQIGASENPFFIDSTVQAGQRYMYYVVAETQEGEVSDQSNLVAFPLLTPPMTFTRLLREVDRLDRRQRFRSVKRMTKVLQQVEDAQSLAVTCQISEAIKTLNPQKASRAVVKPEATDLEILMTKLVRRLTLFNQFPQDVSSDEFCTSP